MGLTSWFRFTQPKDCFPRSLCFSTSDKLFSTFGGSCLQCKKRRQPRFRRQHGRPKLSAESITYPYCHQVKNKKSGLKGFCLPTGSFLSLGLSATTENTRANSEMSDPIVSHLRAKSSILADILVKTESMGAEGVVGVQDWKIKGGKSRGGEK